MTSASSLHSNELKKAAIHFLNSIICLCYYYGDVKLPNLDKLKNTTTSKFSTKKLPIAEILQKREPETQQIETNQEETTEEKPTNDEGAVGQSSEVKDEKSSDEKDEQQETSEQKPSEQQTPEQQTSEQQPEETTNEEEKEEEKSEEEKSEEKDQQNVDIIEDYYKSAEQETDESVYYSYKSVSANTIVVILVVAYKILSNFTHCN